MLGVAFIIGYLAILSSFFSRQMTTSIFLSFPSLNCFSSWAPCFNSPAPISRDRLRQHAFRRDQNEETIDIRSYF